MVRISAVYTGGKHCGLVHGPSRSEIETDAPKDNQGRGERFSPTDLMGAAYASCILTTMAIVAERDGVSIEGATAETEKEMIPQPRRIGSLKTRIVLPAGVPLDYRARLEDAGRNCPVHRSLNPEINSEITFSYRD